MATTTFVNGSTLTDDDWYNDVDALVYDVFNEKTTAGTTGTLIYSNGTNLVNSTAATLYCLGDTANANMTAGLTINQGTNDNEILSLKSDDVTHGLTSVTETDTYFALLKASAANGIAHLIGLRASDDTAIIVEGIVSGAANTTKSTA